MPKSICKQEEAFFTLNSSHCSAKWHAPNFRATEKKQGVFSDPHSIANVLLLWRFYCYHKIQTSFEHLFKKIDNLVVEKSLDKQRKAFLKKVIFQLLRRIKNIHWSKLYQKYTRWIKRVLQLLLVKGCKSFFLR